MFLKCGKVLGSVMLKISNAMKMYALNLFDLFLLFIYSHLFTPVI